MKKRILSFILTLAMVFSMLPTMGLTASAADVHTHTICGRGMGTTSTICAGHTNDPNDESHGTEDFYPLSEYLAEYGSTTIDGETVVTYKNPSSTTTYAAYGFYLDKDIIMAEPLKIGKYLCLNGNTISSTDDRTSSTIVGTSNLESICDCSNNKTGTIKGGEKTSLVMSYTSDLKLFDVTIDGGDISVGVRAASDDYTSSLYMFGGKITNCTSAVEVNAGPFYMYDGEITGNHSTTAAVYLTTDEDDYSYFYMYGGSIHDNVGDNYGGVHVSEGDFWDYENTLVISGGSIYKNYNSSGKLLNIYSAGTGVSVSGTGQIGTADETDVGYGIYLTSDGLKVSGENAKIYSPVYFSSGVHYYNGALDIDNAPIYVESDLGSDNQITVKCSTPPTATSDVKIADLGWKVGIPETLKNLFVVEDNKYEIIHLSENDRQYWTLSLYDIEAADAYVGVASKSIPIASAAHDTVSMTITPSDGCVVTSVTAVGADRTRTSATEQSDGTWQFTMPTADVEIEIETAYEVTVGLTNTDYSGDNITVYVYDEFGAQAGSLTQTLSNSVDYESTFEVPMTYTDNYGEERVKDISKYTIKIGKLDGYTANLSEFISNPDDGLNFAITLTEAEKVDVTVTDTTYVWDGTEKNVTISNVTPSTLSADDFDITYYLINESSDGALVKADTPTGVGKYVYVVSFKTDSDYSAYVFENEYINPDAYDDQYYPITAQAAPSDSVSYSNTGFMTIKATDQPLGTISFNAALVNQYLDTQEYFQDYTFVQDTGYTGDVNFTWTSSDESIATVDGGDVTFKKDGIVTITVTAKGDASVSPISASYVLNITKRPVTVTMEDCTVTYGDAVPKLEWKADATDYIIEDIWLSVNAETTYTKGDKIGSYPITATANSAIYEVTVVPGTLTVNPKELTVNDFEVVASNKTYDGTTTATVTATVKTDSLVNSGDQVSVLVTANFDDANAGSDKQVSYTITGLTGSDAGNYKITSDISGTTTATIDQVSVNVFASSASHVYDGTAKDLTVIAMANGSFFTDFTKIYTYGDDESTASPTDIGTYTLVLTPNDTTNYEFATYSGTLTILAANGDFMALRPESPIYYGDTDKKIEIVGDSGYTVTYEVTTGDDIVSVDTDGSLTFSGVGDVTIKVTGTKANYETETQTISFTVKPRPVSAVVTVSNREYDGTSDMQDEVTGIILTDYAGEDVTEVTATVVSASISSPNVGEHTATVVLELTGDKSGCYALTSTQVYDTVSISKKTVTISIVAEDKVYDGTIAADVTVELDGVISGEEDYVSVVGSAVFEDANASTDKTVTYTAQGLLGDKSGNYQLSSATATDTATISQRPVIFTFGTLEFPYNGEAHEVEISAETDDAKVFADYTVSYQQNGSEVAYPTNAGSYDVVIAIDDANYKFADSYEQKWMTIKTVDQDEMIITNIPSAAPQYATTFTLDTFGGSGNGAVVWSSDDTDVATVDENTGLVTVTGVGNVIITATKQSDGNYNEISATVTITTAKRDVVFTISNLTQTYDGSVKTATVTPSVSGAVYDVTYTGDNATNGQAVNAGTYTVTVTATGNYDGSATATMTINKADIDVNGFAVADTTYGVNPTVTYPTNIPTGVESELIYIVDGEERSAPPKNASEADYTAKLVLTGDNYNTKTLEDTFKIGKATLTVTAQNAKRAYGQNNPEFTFSYSGFVYDETKEVVNVEPVASTEANPYSEVGTYDITVSGGVDDNYTFEYVKGTLTVTAVDDDGIQYLPDQDGDGQPEIDDDSDGIYDGSDSDNQYIPDQDGDEKPEKVTDEDEDGVYEDEAGNQYIPDQDGDGKVEPDADGDGVFEGTDSDNTYIPDQDGDGTPEVDDDGDGVYDGTVDADDDDDPDNTYIPDQDGDGKPEVDDDGDGVYDGTDSDNRYIPDQDGDKKPEVDNDGDGIFEGTADEDENGESDNTYVPDQDGDGEPENVVNNGDGTYSEDEDGDGQADEDGNSYIPDQDGDGKPEVDDDGDGVYDGTVDEDGDGIPDNTYIPDQDGDGTPEVDDDGDGVYDGTVDEDGDGTPDNTYIPDQDGDGTPEVDDDGDGVYDGTVDEDGDGTSDNIYIPDQDGDGEPENVVDNGDGTYSEDEDGDGQADDNAETYVPDQDGDGQPEKIEDEDGDGVFEDENGNEYIPDQDGDGKAETDSDNDGIFEGSDNDEGDDDHFYVPDGDDADSDPDEVIDNGNGTYTDPGDDGEVGTDDDGPSYIPDQDGDGRAEVDDNGDGVYDGTVDEDGDGESDNTYVPVDKNGDGVADNYVDAEDVNNGVWKDPETGKEYIDRNNDGILEPKPYYPIIVPVFYDITVNSAVNGDVSVNRKTAASGTTITLTVDPDDGYELNTLTVTDRYGNAITVTEKANGTYTFRMPAKDVWVTAIFTKTSTGDTPVHICPSKEFYDVNTNLWYHEAIDFVLWNGYMNGMGNGQFQPGTALSRAMIVQVLYNMENKPDYQTKATFEDVKSGEWYYDAINWAAENGIVEGYSADAFGPNDPITREQMAAILYRYADYKGIDVSDRGNLSNFTDGGKTSAWAVDAVRWAVEVGLISGKGNGVLDPTGTATRAEVAQILMNYCKKVLGE